MTEKEAKEEEESYQKEIKKCDATYEQESKTKDTKIQELKDLLDRNKRQLTDEKNKLRTFEDDLEISEVKRLEISDEINNTNTKIPKDPGFNDADLKHAKAQNKLFADQLAALKKDIEDQKKQIADKDKKTDDMREDLKNFEKDKKIDVSIYLHHQVFFVRKGVTFAYRTKLKEREKPEKENKINCLTIRKKSMMKILKQWTASMTLRMKSKKKKKKL